MRKSTKKVTNTVDSPELFSFSPVENKSVQCSFTSPDLSPFWGGDADA